MIGYCEAEDEVDLYMIRGETSADDKTMWLCWRHRP